MLNFIIKKLVGAVFFLLVLSVVCLVIISQSGVLNSLDGLGIHIGINDVIHPDNLVDSIEQNLNTQIN